MLEPASMSGLVDCMGMTVAVQALACSTALRLLTHINT